MAGIDVVAVAAAAAANVARLEADATAVQGRARPSAIAAVPIWFATGYVRVDREAGDLSWAVDGGGGVKEERGL